MIKLILKDASNEIIINTNRSDLQNLAPYFQKLLTFGKERDQDEIVIEVNHVGVALNVIKDIYQKPEYEWVLETIRQQIYFNMNDVDLSSLDKLDVPSEGFDLLMQTLQELNYPISNKLKDLIRKIMPEDYDLSKLPKKFIEELIAHTYYLATGSCGTFSVKIWKGACISTVSSYSSTQNIQNCTAINFSLDGNLMACVSRNSIYIHEITTGTMINKFTKEEIHLALFTTDTLVIVYGQQGKIIIEQYDKDESYRLLSLIHMQYPHTIDKKAISPDASIITLIPNNSTSVHVIDTLTGNELYCFNENTQSMDISSNNMIALASDDGTIKIYDKYRHIKSLTHDCAAICCKFSTNGKLFASIHHDCNIKIWDMLTYCCFRTIRINIISHRISFSPDNQYIAIPIWNLHKDRFKLHASIWDINKGEKVVTLPIDEDNTISCFTFSNFHYNDLDKKLLKALA